MVGHSRGGEAVAIAAAFNKLERYPNSAWIKWDFNFEIKSVIAIAPVDQQHKPAGHPVEIVDVNYLVLHGAHDADVSKYYGLRQIQRVTFTDPESNLFKAGLYIYQANHGQFNSVWGNRDYGLPLKPFLNVRPLLKPEEQQQIAKLYISAFL
ncbi:alpha/beta hydrolase, partial [bacterium (candidate division B38) B3_B38]